MAELIDLIDNALSVKSRDEWGKIFDEAGLIWGPVMGLHEVPQDPHAQELGMFPKISHPELGDYTTVNIPMRFANADVNPKGPSPLLGEHTQQVLENAGFSAADISDLRSQGIVNDA
jgi:crotonobetainyl-CoA:carnitine CoA-transferase CaiB-like acyl-CoA transferase